MLRRAGVVSARAISAARTAAPAKNQIPLSRGVSTSLGVSRGRNPGVVVVVAAAAVAVGAAVAYDAPVLAEAKVSEQPDAKKPEKSSDTKKELETQEAKAKRLSNLHPVENLEDLEIVLYQYQTCPFCTKVRTFLDYHNIPYRIVEVDPLRKTEIGFSKYKKVPICVVQGVQLTESSEIISIIESLVPRIKSKASSDEVVSSLKWCKWVDDWLVHLLPANIYRTPTEAIESFDYLLNPQYSFGTMERYAARYVGASVMYLVTKYKLNKKYNITNPREQFYQAVNEWIDAIGDKDFMSGTYHPGRADLAVYATIRSVEGTSVFEDLLANTKMERWYNSMKAAVGHCKGTHVPSKETPTPKFPIA